MDNLNLRSGIPAKKLAELPREAHRQGGHLVIVNQQPTPLDDLAQPRLFESIADVLPPTVKRVKGLMGLHD